MLKDPSERVVSRVMSVLKAPRDHRATKEKLGRWVRRVRKGLKDRPGREGLWDRRVWRDLTARKEEKEPRA